MSSSSDCGLKLTGPYIHPKEPKARRLRDGQQGRRRRQTQRAQPAQGRAISELRNSPTRPKGGAAPNKK